MPNIHGATWLIDAYCELATARQYTFAGAGPIPINIVWEWADRFNAPDWFPEAVMMIDSKFLEGANG